MFFNPEKKRKMFYNVHFHPTTFLSPPRFSHRFSEGEVQSRGAADAMRSEALVFGHLQGWKVWKVGWKDSTVEI